MMNEHSHDIVAQPDLTPKPANVRADDPGAPLPCIALSQPGEKGCQERMPLR